MTQTQFAHDKDSFVNKLPMITASFWVMKILATTLGETGGDWLSMTMGLGYLVSTLIFFGLFVIAVSTQLAVKRHHAFLYWFVIITTSTAGRWQNTCDSRSDEDQGADR